MSTPTMIYPVPTAERRAIVQRLSDVARSLDAEAERRSHPKAATLRAEVRRSAGVVRFVATLIVQGRMSTRKANFWMVAATEYLELVERADRRGVIA